MFFMMAGVELFDAVKTEVKEMWIQILWGLVIDLFTLQLTLQLLRPLFGTKR